MRDCIFCKIISGGIPCDKVFEDENFLAFLDIQPVGEGHTLVIPKKHFEKVSDLDKKYSSLYLDFLKKVSNLLAKKYNSDGFNIVLNNGESAGQVVKHVHFHILPRKIGDKKRGLFLG